jgi:hypothetical protein
MDSIAVQAAQLAMKTASPGNDSRRADNASAMQAAQLAIQAASPGNDFTDRFVRSVSPGHESSPSITISANVTPHRQAEHTEQTKQDKRAERAKQDKIAEKQINEVRGLIEQGVDLDGITLKKDSENRTSATYQFDWYHPAFQDPEDMGIRTITHSGIKNWKDLVDQKLAPQDFKSGKIKYVLTKTTYDNRGLFPGGIEYTFTRRAGSMWRPSSQNEAD